MLAVKAPIPGLKSKLASLAGEADSVDQRTAQVKADHAILPELEARAATLREGIAHVAAGNWVIWSNGVDQDWAAKVKGMLRAEMARRQVTCQGLADRLGKIVVKESEANSRNKIRRG